MSSTSPAPGVDAQYQTSLESGTFVIQHCQRCGRYVFQPRQHCPHCDSIALVWHRPSGLGTVYSATAVRLKGNAPYNVSLVDLDEGVRMMSRVEGIPCDAVRIGMRVRASVSGVGADALVVFHPIGDSA